MALGSFCRTPLWNRTVSWDTNDPYISQCFHHMVLVCGSCGVLWVLAPFEYIKISRHKGSPTPWTTTAIIKMALNVLLLNICVVELAKELYSYMHGPSPGADGLVAAVIYFITIVLTVVLSILCKKRGFKVSLILPSFWMLSTVTTLLSMYSDIQDVDMYDWIGMVSLVDDSLVFIISLLQLIFTIVHHKPSAHTGPRPKDCCPLEDESLFSRLTFSWLLNVLKKGQDNSLHQDHLLPLCSELEAMTAAESFERARMGKHRLDHDKSVRNSETEFREFGLDSSVEHETHNPTVRKERSLGFVLIKVSSKFLFINLVLEIVFTALYFLPVFVISLILDEIHLKNDFKWHGYFYATLLFLSLMVSCFADSQRVYYGIVAAARIKSALIDSIYSKLFRLCSEAQKQHCQEDIKQHLTEDTEHVFQMACRANELWGGPLRIGIGIYLLWTYLGAACFVGIATAVFLIPLNLLVSELATKIQKKRHEARHERLSLLSESLYSMKILKLNAWEEPFMKRIFSLRKIELSHLRKAEVLRMIFSFLTFSALSIVSLSTFATYYFLMQGQKTMSMDVKTIFLSLTFIFLLKSPLTNLPYVLSHLVQGLASASRIQSFLNAEEVDPGALSNQPNMGECVTLEKAWFSRRGFNQNCLKDITLHIDKGSLVAVVGVPGSGKSSLLQSLFGEMRRTEGSAHTKGRIAFVQNKPWIQNATLELNILLDKQKIDPMYRRTIEACSLSSDLDMLPAGDETPIGEMGIELTAEQKQKVSLARAVYQNADLYLLDDPLRDLNDGLANHLFRRVVGRTGLLRTKTRIIVTSRTEVLPLVDLIVIMENGCIAGQGTYVQLMEKNTELVDCLKYNTPSESHNQPSEEGYEQTPTANEFKDPVARNPSYFTSAISAVSDQEVTDDGIDFMQKGFLEKLFGHMKIIGWLSVTLTILSAGLASSCEIGGTVWLSDWVDKRIDNSDQRFPLEIYAAFIAAEVFFTVLTGALSLTGSTVAADNLHTCLLSRVMRAPQTYFDTMNYEEILRSFDSDLDSVDVKIPQTFHFWLLSALWLPAALVAISFISPLIILAYLPLFVAYYAIQSVYLSPSQQLKRLRCATSRPLANLFQESLDGLLYIRAFQAQPYFTRRLRYKLDTHLNSCLLSFLSSRWLSTSLNIVGAVLVFVTSVVAVSAKQSRAGLTGLAIFYSMQIADGLRTLIISNSILESDIMPLHGIQLLCQMKQEAEWEEPSIKPASHWPVEGSIYIENLSTTYGEGQYPVLHDVTIDIKPREKVAIVGGPSCGKCTLLSTLFRLIEPAAGTISIGGVDIKDIGLHDLRSRLAFIPQDPIIFEGSVRYNLDPCDHFSDEDIWKALEAVELSNYVTTLDSPADKQMRSEYKHRLSLARSILSKPKIVIVENMTPISEPITTRAMQYLVRRVHNESTILTIYDHPRHALDNDRIILIASGVVVEEGDPNRLYDDTNSKLYSMMMEEGYLAGYSAYS